ncbi:putative cyclin-dependent protein kinase inhibitor SMR3 [Forsythia ovata]|uniref:Cyclin-dependent protein kinase inhibitor SMR3 n=1 Tax=Forsythia ovata TaxID=205694 RepID=A0ABD1UVA3_9LAMI
MGVTKKQGGKESEAKKWVIAGIGIRPPLKSISTKPKEGCEDYDECSTTPTARESKIPEILYCPPAPRKQRPSSKFSMTFSSSIHRTWNQYLFSVMREPNELRILGLRDYLPLILVRELVSSQ